MSTTCDFLVVGGGIAGATAAYHLAPHGKVVLVERESTLAYHTTGRSAAQYFLTYGGPEIVKLNALSHPFLSAPPEGFSDVPLLSERGAMFFARADQLPRMERFLQESVAAGAEIFRIDPQEAIALVPVLRPEYVAGALREPGSMDMDVHAIHQGFIRGARRLGAVIAVDAEVTALSSHHGVWRVTTRAGEYQTPVVVNAAGAWCDELAALAGISPVGLTPKRRTAILTEAPSGLDISGWPLTIDIDEELYFKPDAGQLLVSPADETPVAPCDIQPEALDIALVVDRLQRATTLQVRRIAHRWAGLRSFVAGGNLVIGEEPGHPGFFWLAGQGGYGIQTSPAAGRACADLIVHGALAEDLREARVTEASLGPGRLRTAWR